MIVRSFEPDAESISQETNKLLEEENQATNYQG